MYILRSKSKGSYYVGQTDDLERRIEEHNNWEEKATRLGCPWEIVYTEAFATRSQAVRREREIKGRKKRAYIERLISERGAAR